MAKNRIITVQDIPITISETSKDDYICITDIATAKSDNSRAADIVKNWMRNRNTLDFWGHGNKCIIMILKWSNSTTLNKRPGYIHLY